jgi:hypothetical protein
MLRSKSLGFCFGTDVAKGSRGSGVCFGRGGVQFQKDVAKEDFLLPQRDRI